MSAFNFPPLGNNAMRDLLVRSRLVICCLARHNLLTYENLLQELEADPWKHKITLKQLRLRSQADVMSFAVAAMED